MRSPAGFVTKPAWSRSKRSVRRSIAKPSSSSKRTARSRRSGSASNTPAPTARTIRASRSPRPANGSTCSPPASGRAIALIVKSRVARSSSIEPRSGVKSTVRLSGQRDPPAAVRGGEWKRCAVRVRHVRPRRPLRLGAGDIEVEYRPSEQLVADGAADDVRLLAGEDLDGTLKHRRTVRVARSGAVLMPVTSSYVIVPACRACSSASRPSPISVTGVPGSADPASSTANESIETVPTTRHRLPATSTSVPVRSRRKPSA